MKKLRMFMVMVLSAALFVLVGCGEKIPPKPEGAASLSDFITEEDVAFLRYQTKVQEHKKLIINESDGKVTYLIDENGKDISKILKDWYSQIDSLYFEKEGQISYAKESDIAFVVDSDSDAFVFCSDGIYSYKDGVKTSYTPIDTARLEKIVTELVNKLAKAYNE